MKKFTCIVCPNGCDLEIDENTLEVSGNKCLRGKNYAVSEITAPKRSVTSSVRTSLKEYPCVSVRTDGEIPKEMIFDLIKELKKIVINEYLPIGSIVVKDILHTGINIITTTNMTKEEN